MICRYRVYQQQSIHTFITHGERFESNKVKVTLVTETEKNLTMEAINLTSIINSEPNHTNEFNDNDIFILQSEVENTSTYNVYTGIHTQMLENPKKYNISIKDLFPVGSYWSSKKALKSQLDVHAAKHGFVVKFFGRGQIVCNRHKSKSKTNPFKRGFLDGHLGCGCKFGMQLHSKIQKQINENGKTKRNRPDYESGEVSIKSFIYEHTDGCLPSQQQLQFCCSRSGKYSSKIPLGVYWQLCSQIKRNPKKFVASSSIRAALSGSFPTGYNITKQDIFNTRLRCKRMMKKFNTCTDYINFEQTLDSDSHFLKMIESDKTLENDEATELINELFDQMFNKNQCDQSNSSGDDEDEDGHMKFQDYLQLLASKAKGFQYRVAIDSHGIINGVVWMTASMRSNFERFGTYLSLDSMKRKLNTLHWPYFAITLMNELNKVCVGCEALLISERDEAYDFLIKSTLEMCPKRNKKDISIVSGDGFFNQSSLEKWGLCNAKFIADHWHLFDSGLKDRFSMTYYHLIEHNLRKMANAHNEQQMNIAYNDAKQQLYNLNLRNCKAEKELDEFYNERVTYALYLIKRIPGNRGRRGSVASEINHASVISLVYGDKETKTYMEHPHVMIRDLFIRQRRHNNEFNKLLWGLTNKRNNYLHIHETSNNQRGNSINYNLIKEAVMTLNFNSFKLFESELKQSTNYVMYQKEDEVGDYICIMRIGYDTPGRIFRTSKQRCDCDFRLSNLMPCKHEICKDRKFDLQFFDIQHHYRESTSLSYHIGEENNIDPTIRSTTISNIMSTVQLSEEGCVIDNFGSDVNDNNHNNEDEDMFNIDNNSELLTQPCTTIMLDNSQNTYQEEVQSFLSFKNIQNIQNDIMNNYKNLSKEHKESISSILILLNNFTKTNGDSTQCQRISETSSGSKVELQNIVRSYNMAFAPAHNAFQIDNVIRPSQQQHNGATHKRKQPIHEIERRKVRRLKQHAPKCSFCGKLNHKIRNCPRRAQLLVNYKTVENCYTFINYLCDDVPVLHPNPELNVENNCLEKTNHVIVHKEIYSKTKSNYYSSLKMSEMIFTVSVLSKDNASVLKDRIVVTGTDLETYIHQTSSIKNRFVFDGTKITSMYDHTFNKRVPIINQLSQQSMYQCISPLTIPQPPSGGTKRGQDPPDDYPLTAM